MNTSSDELASDHIYIDGSGNDEHGSDYDPDDRAAGDRHNNDNVPMVHRNIGFLNAAGIANKLNAIQETMSEYDCVVTLVSETKQHCNQNSTSHPYIAASSRPPNIRAGVPTKHGVALLACDDLWGSWRNEITVQATDSEGHFFIWTHGEAQFIGLYLPPITNMASLDEAKRIVNDAMMQADIRPKLYRFIVGDLNIRMDIGSTRVLSAQHREIIDELSNFGFERVPMTEGTFTFFGQSPDHPKSILDHAFANANGMQLRPTVQALDKAHQRVHNSDHCYMILSVDIPTHVVIETNEDYWGYNTGKLRNDITFNQFKLTYESLTSGLDEMSLYSRASEGNCRHAAPADSTDRLSWRPELIDSQEYIDKLEVLVLEPLRETVEGVLGRNPRKGRRIPPVRSSARLLEMRTEKTELIESMKNEWMITTDHHLRLKELNEGIEAEMTHLRNKGFYLYYQSIDTMPGNEVAKVLRSVTASRTKKLAALQSEPEDMEAYRTFFEGQYTSPSGNGRDIDMPDDINEREPRLIDEDDIGKWIRWMSTGKAPGVSKMSIELFKAAMPTVTMPLVVLFNECIRLRRVPTSWTKAILVPIPKKERPNGIGDHRPISLTEHVRKLFEHIVHEVVTYAVEPLNAVQCGFRAERSTLDQAATLHEIMSQHKIRTRKDIEVVFLDIKAAYDSVDRRILWRKCLEKGVPLWTVEILTQLFDNCESYIVLRNRESRPFRHAAGLMQGSVLSPTLYSIFIDDLADDLDAATDLTVDGRPIGGLFYADDIALIADSPAKMKRLLRVCEEHSFRNNYRFNVRKCETFAPAGTYRIYGEPVIPTDRFKYLGIHFSAKGIDWPYHIDVITKKALKTAAFFKSIGMNGYGMGERVKLTVYKLFIRSRMEYGLAIMPRIKGLLKLWNQSQDTILRWMFSVGDTATTIPIRTLLHLQDAEIRHDELTSRWICAATLKTGADFLIERAYNEAKRNLTSKSSFKYATSQANELMNLLRIRELVGRPLWRKFYKTVRNEYLSGKLETERLKCHFKDAFLIHRDCIPRQAYEIGRLPRASHRIIILYLTGRLTGRPSICEKCGLRKAAQRHVFECAGPNAIDAYIRGKRYMAAKPMIVNAMLQCAPDKGEFYDRMSEML